MTAEKTRYVDLYQVLGVIQNATLDEINNNYFKLSLKNHPDKGGDIEKYREIQMAYSILKNPENRKNYDNSLATTYTELKTIERNTKYHTNTEYINATTGKFDIDKFMKEFNKNYKQAEDEIKPMTTSSYCKVDTTTIVNDTIEDVTQLLNKRLIERDTALTTQFSTEFKSNGLCDITGDATDSFSQFATFEKCEENNQLGKNDL